MNAALFVNISRLKLAGVRRIIYEHQAPPAVLRNVSGMWPLVPGLNCARVTVLPAATPPALPLAWFLTPGPGSSTTNDWAHFQLQGLSRASIMPGRDWERSLGQLEYCPAKEEGFGIWLNTGRPGNPHSVSVSKQPCTVQFQAWGKIGPHWVQQTMNINQGA